MSIAEKYAAQWLPNGEVSLAALIQSAVDEAERLLLTGARAELATLRASLEQAEQERDELRKDSERLQYMIDDTAIIMYSVGIDRTLCRVEWPLTGYVQDAFYPSERAAIDAAIAQEGSDESTRCGQP